MGYPFETMLFRLMLRDQEGFTNKLYNCNACPKNQHTTKSGCDLKKQIHSDWSSSNTYMIFTKRHAFCPNAFVVFATFFCTSRGIALWGFRPRRYHSQNCVKSAHNSIFESTKKFASSQKVLKLSITRTRTNFDKHLV